MSNESGLRLAGKTGFVTGATGLLGREHCFALAEAGAAVVVADIDLAKAEGLARDLGRGSFAVRCDVTNRESVEAALAVVAKEREGVDVLVNNAAINDMFENPQAALEKSRFENYPLELWQKMFAVNVTGTFLTCQVVGAAMAKRGSGSIVNIASTYGLVGPDQSLYVRPDGSQAFYKSAAYPATKGAVIAFTRFLAAYWGSAGVRVNTLSPGGVENGQEEFFLNAYAKRTPLGRMAKPDDYRGALVFLASDESRYMTGANLVVDGGFTTW